MSITCGTDVTWTRPGRRCGHTAEGTVKAFINAYADGGWVLLASVLVTAGTGLYRRGDVITVAVAELEAVTA